MLLFNKYEEQKETVNFETKLFCETLFIKTTTNSEEL